MNELRWEDSEHWKGKGSHLLNHDNNMLAISTLFTNCGGRNVFKSISSRQIHSLLRYSMYNVLRSCTEKETFFSFHTQPKCGRYCDSWVQKQKLNHFDHKFEIKCGENKQIEAGHDPDATAMMASRARDAWSVCPSCFNYTVLVRGVHLIRLIFRC